MLVVRTVRVGAAQPLHAVILIVLHAILVFLYHKNEFSNSNLVAEDKRVVAMVIFATAGYRTAV